MKRHKWFRIIWGYDVKYCQLGEMTIYPTTCNRGKVGWGELSNWVQKEHNSNMCYLVLSFMGCFVLCSLIEFGFKPSLDEKKQRVFCHDKSSLIGGEPIASNSLVSYCLYNILLIICLAQQVYCAFIGLLVYLLSRLCMYSPIEWKNFASYLTFGSFVFFILKKNPWCRSLYTMSWIMTSV